jgi:hypothetical protein
MEAISPADDAAPTPSDAERRDQKQRIFEDIDRPIRADDEAVPPVGSELVFRPPR